MPRRRSRRWSSSRPAVSQRGDCAVSAAIQPATTRARAARRRAIARRSSRAASSRGDRVARVPRPFGRDDRRACWAATWRAPATCRWIPPTRAARNRDVLADAGVAAVLTTTALRARLPDGPVVDDSRSTRSSERRVAVTGPARALARPARLRPLHVRLDRAAEGRGHHPRQPAAVDAGPAAGLPGLRRAVPAPAEHCVRQFGRRASSGRSAAGGTLVIPTDDEVRDIATPGAADRREQVHHACCASPRCMRSCSAPAPAGCADCETVIVAGESCPSRLVEEHFTRAAAGAAVQRIRSDRGHRLGDGSRDHGRGRVRAVPIGRPIPGVRVEVRDPLGRRCQPGSLARRRSSGRPSRAATGDATTSPPNVSNVDPERTNRRTAATAPGTAWPGPRTAACCSSAATTSRSSCAASGSSLERSRRHCSSIRASPGGGRGADARAAATAADAASTQSRRVCRREGRRRRSRAGAPALAPRLPDHMLPRASSSCPSCRGCRTARSIAGGCVGPAARRRDSRVAAGRGRRARANRRCVPLWEALLGRFGIGVTDNFFELGGHSLLVVQMVAAIERDFEVALTAADVFQHPTVRELAGRIEQRGGPERTPISSSFPIQPAGQKPPFIMASPDFFTEALAARFRGERPVYGFRGVSLRPEGNRGRWPTMTRPGRGDRRRDCVAGFRVVRMSSPGTRLARGWRSRPCACWRLAACRSSACI